MRFVLFPVLTIIGVLATVTFWSQIFPVVPTLESTGIHLWAWFGIAILWCLGGGLFSWLFSRDIAMWSTDTQIKDETDRDDPLVIEVETLAREMGFKKMPVIGVYRSPETNIFSSGPYPGRMVVSVGEGFLNLPAEVRTALIYAELYRAKDLETALLIFCQGLTNGFVLYLSRLLAFLLGTSYRQTEGASSSTLPEMIMNVLMIVFLTFGGTVFVAYLSRRRQRSGYEAIKSRYGEKVLKQVIEQLEGAGKTLEHYDLFTMALKAAHKRRFLDVVMPTHPRPLNFL